MKKHVLSAALLLVVLCSSVSATLINNTQVFSGPGVRVAIDALFADQILEVGPLGNVTFGGRTDMSANNNMDCKIIMNGGILNIAVGATDSGLELPDDARLPYGVRVLVNSGTMTCARIQNFGAPRNAKILIGGGILIVQSNYLSGSERFDPAMWVASGGLAAQPGYELKLTNLGAGAVKIEGESVPIVPAMPCPQFSAGVSLGNLTAFTETSGIVASRKNADVFWVHNDSGDSARVYAINRNRTKIGTYNLSGAWATDYEDIAIGPGSVAGVDYLYIGDIGDNGASRSNITVYRVAEPFVSSTQSPVTVTLSPVDALRLQYPDGAKNAEVLMLDLVTRDLYIITKGDPSRVYRAPYPQSTTATTTMQYKCLLPWYEWRIAMGGDISPEGNMIIVKGEAGSGQWASIWYLEPATNLWEAFVGPQCDVPFRSEPQGEAICFDADGCGYYTISEGSNQPLWYFSRQDNCNLAGDLVRDGVIDLKDFAVFAADWPFDLNGDGNADIQDLKVITDIWLEIEEWP